MMLAPKLRGKDSAGKNTPLIGGHDDYLIAYALSSWPWTVSTYFHAPMFIFSFRYSRLEHLCTWEILQKKPICRVWKMQVAYSLCQIKSFIFSEVYSPFSRWTTWFICWISLVYLKYKDHPNNYITQNVMSCLIKIYFISLSFIDKSKNNNVTIPIDISFDVWWLSLISNTLH